MSGESKDSGRAVTSRALTFVVPGRIDTRTGGYAVRPPHDRRPALIVDGSSTMRELERQLSGADAIGALDDAEAGTGRHCRRDDRRDRRSPLVQRHAGRRRSGTGRACSIVPIVHALIASEVGIDRATAGPARRRPSDARLDCAAPDRRRPASALIEPLVRSTASSGAASSVVDAWRRSRAAGARIESDRTTSAFRDRRDAQSWKGCTSMLVPRAARGSTDRRWRADLRRQRGTASRHRRRACDRC